MILTVVNNDIVNDGRVERAVEALQPFGSVHLICTGMPAVTDDTRGYKVHRVYHQSGDVKHMHFWRSIVTLAIRLRPKVIYAHDHFIALPASIAAQIIKAEFIYDAHELNVEKKAGSARDRFWYWTERYAIRRAKLIIAANAERSHIMVDHYGLSNPPTVIHNYPPAPESISNDLSKSDRSVDSEKVRLVYQGAVDDRRGLSRFIDSLEYLSNEYEMTIVGDGPSLAQFERKYRQFVEDGRLKFLGQVTRARLNELLMLSDIGIVCYGYDSMNSIYCASNKIVEYAHARLPVVTTDQPPLLDSTRKYGIGLSIERTASVKRVAEAIRDVSSNRASYVERIPNYLQNVSWENEATKLVSGFRQVIN